MPKPSASVAAVTDVRLTIQSDPKRVEVYLGEHKLGVSPDDEIRLERSESEVELTLKAEGYLSSKIKVRPSADAVVSTKLSKKVQGGGPKRPEVEF
jgi:serine/threonine-protein kinase